jgi:hypothetical protein
MPARAKGTAIIQMIKALKSFPNQGRTLLPARLHHYLEGRILISNWYPEADYFEIISAVAKAYAPRMSDPWETLGRLSAQRDLSTVYRALCRPAPLLVALEWVREVFRMYHDSGRFVIEGDDNFAHMDVFDYATVSANNCRMITAYSREHLKMCYQREIPVSEVMCRATGADRCRREYTYVPE